MKYTPINEVLSDKISGEWGVEPEGDYGVKVIRTANFTNLGVIDFSNIVLRKIESKKIEQKKLISCDVIIEKSGGSPAQPVGRVVYFENPDNSIYLCNNFTTALRPNKSIVFPKYLFYILFYNHLTKRTLRFQNKTTGIINLRLENYLRSKIPLPPLDDQIRIAAVLTRVEKLISKRKESIKALDELLKSTFLEMFGDPQINPKDFPLVELHELYIDSKNGTKCGPFGSVLKKEEFVNNGIPVWNMDNISKSGQMVMPLRMWISLEKYRALEAYSVLNGDVIISRAGTVGKMCVARMAHDEKSIISTNLIRVRFGNKLLPLYFVSLMNYCKGRVGRLKTGPDGAFTHMSTRVLDTLTFACPPIELQNQFAAIVEKVDLLKAKYNQSLGELENLYGSLSQRAFKGELDLSKVPVVYEIEKKVENIKMAGS